MKLHIPVDRVEAIWNMGDEGSAFQLLPDEYYELSSSSFVEALKAYCDAVDQGKNMLTVEHTKEAKGGAD